MGRRVKWLNVAELTDEQLGAENFAGLTAAEVRAYLLGLAKEQKITANG